MNGNSKITSEELNRYFELDSRVKSRARQVADICTDICGSEEIETVYEEGDEIHIGVWSFNCCGHDHYEFSKTYMFMSDDEIKNDLDRKQKEYEQQLKEEEKAAKKRALEHEKREYERLKKKFGGK